MATYQVKRARRDKNGTILALCGDGWTKSKADLVREIDGKVNRYYVEEQAPRVDVVTFELAGEKHLITIRDKTSKNNLDNLPPC